MTRSQKFSWLGSLCIAVAVTGCKAYLKDSADSDAPATNGVELPGGLRLHGKPKYFRVVRLTHAQWENSVQDVLLLSEAPGLSGTFITDPPDGLFSNNERALYVSDTLQGDYQRSAESLAEKIAADPTQLGKLSAPGDSAGFIASVGRRAFRRSLSAEEQAAYATLWASGATFFASGDAFADGARVFIEALLLSPSFVYRVELTPDGGRLSGTELATKLSYLLRNTTPSTELLDAAEAGQLATEQGVRDIVTSMLDEEATRLVVENFHRELFGLDRYKSILKNPTTFPTFDESLNPILLAADLLFFSQVYTEGLGFREILTSNTAFIDGRTAGFYGLTSNSASLVPTLLDGSRPGFLTRLGFLAYNANLSDPDPIHRGVDINNRLLCADIEPPPGEIPPLPAPVPGQTNRERVTAHTGEGFCANCHNKIINPPGFALEAFDAIGQARTTDNGKPIDTTGEMQIGTEVVPFASVVELTNSIATSQVAHSCYAAHLSEFAFARDLGPNETLVVSSLQNQSIAEDASLKQMLFSLLTSPEFSIARTNENE